MQGFLLVDKPNAISSFGVVAKIRGIIKANIGLKMKVGHSGTLDPEATGLLILAVGSYTKKLSVLIKKDKSYELTMKLGQTSSTGDREGIITDVNNEIPSEKIVKEVLQKFQGDILQTPPAFSAIKVDGKRAYHLARLGKTVELAPRHIQIFKNELQHYEYPYIRIITDVSSGTYVRSLAQDIGEELGTGAYVTELRRTRIGQFNVNQAIKLEDITYAVICDHLITLEK